MRATTCLAFSGRVLAAGLLASLLAGLQGRAAERAGAAKSKDDLEATKHLGDVKTKDDFQATRHEGDVQSLDDFEARWAERRKGHLYHRFESSGHRAKEKTQDTAHHTGGTETHQQASRTASTTPRTAPAPAAQVQAHWLHEGVIVGTIREQLLSWTNRETGESKLLPRIVLVGRTGDEALMPTSANAKLAPYMGKLAKVTCTAIVVPPGPDTGGHHNLVVEQVLKVEPYSSEDETPAVPSASAVTPAAPSEKGPAAPASPAVKPAP